MYSILFVVAAVAVCAFADSKGTCGANLDWELTDGVLTINGTGAMDDFSFTNPPWYSDRSDVTSVVIKGATSIGSSAFQKCAQLKQISLPDTLQSIGEQAFSGCKKLVDLTIPASVTSIDHMSEPFCSGCSSLASIIVKEGNSMFYSFDDALIDREKSAIILFAASSNRTSFSVPDGVSSIGDSAFSGCKNLVNISIPSSVNKISINVFYQCSSLSWFEVSKDNQFFASVDGVLFNTQKNMLVQFPQNNSLTNYIIPDGTKSIDLHAFAYNQHLVTVVVPESVESMLSPFSNCQSLKEVRIDAHIDVIENNAFLHCDKLEKVNIPDGVVSIGYNAFEGCTSLTRIDLPGSLVKIDMEAFLGCSSLTSVTIPANVVSFGFSAFEGCTQLKSVFYQGSTYIDDLLFWDCDDLEIVCVSPYYNSIFGPSFGGVDVTPDKDECKLFRSMINHCFTASYVNGGFIQEELWNTKQWIKENSKCGEYHCINDTGLVAWSLCNSTEEESRLCMADSCFDDWSGKISGWSVIFLFDGNITFEQMTVSELLDETKTILRLKTALNAVVGVETNKSGYVIHAVLRVEDEDTALDIKEAVEDIIGTAKCTKYDILCHVTNIIIQNVRSSSDPVESPSVESATTVTMHMMIFLSLLAIEIILFV